MVAAEFKNARSTVRIHDEYCEALSAHCISRLSHIVSESYRRRRLFAGVQAVKPVAADGMGGAARS